MANEYRIFHITTEVLSSGLDLAPIHLHNVSAEVLQSGLVDAPIHVHGVAVEVLRSIAATIEPLFVDENDDAAYPVAIVPSLNPAFFEDSADEVYAVQVANAPFTIKNVERNPYAPRLPDNPVEADETHREQQRVIREQHNKTQAGDTTFDYGLLLKSYPNKEYTLGSLGRFYHEDYGLILARYCEFRGMLESPVQGVPVGRRAVAGRIDWVVTNDFAKSGRDLVMGLCCVAETPADGTYGWIVTHGCNPVALAISNQAVAAQNDPYSWSEFGKVALGVRGRVLGRRWGKAYLPTVPAGSVFITLEGLSPADLVFEIREAMADEILEIAALDGRVSAVEGRCTSLEGRTTVVESRQNSLENRIAVEEATRARDIAAIRLIASGTDWTTAIRAEANSVRAEFAAADDAIRTLATTAAYNANLAVERTNGFDYAGLLTRINNLDIVFADVAASIPKFNVDPTTLVADYTLISTAAVDSEGNTYYEFTPILFKAVNLKDVDMTGFTSGDRLAWNSLTSKFERGIAYTDEKARIALSVAPSTVATTTYTLVLGDAYEYIRLTNAAGCAVTVPPNSSVAFRIGDTITFRTTASAASSLVAGAGVTLNKVGGGTGNQNFAEIGATAQIKKVGTDEWDIIGAMA